MAVRLCKGPRAVPPKLFHVYFTALGNETKNSSSDLFSYSESMLWNYVFFPNLGVQRHWPLLQERLPVWPTWPEHYNTHDLGLRLWTEELWDATDQRTKWCWCPVKAMLLLLQSHLRTRILPSSPMLPSFLLPLDYVSDGCKELKGVGGKITFSSFKSYCSPSWGRQNRRKHTSQKEQKDNFPLRLPLSARCPVRKVYKAKQLFGHCSPGLPPLQALIPQVPAPLSRKWTSPLHGLCTSKLPGLMCGHHTDPTVLLLWKDSSLFLAL